MKKIKQFSLKAMLLTIAAALTIGFTGCSDELSGDQTQGKPGYLTVNVKTLKPNQSKFHGANLDDYQKVVDLNIFVFSGDNVLIQKYYNTTFNTTQSYNIAVTTLPTDAIVVAVANFGADLSNILTLTQLNGLNITIVKDFATDGLHMTGQAKIIPGTGGYSSDVKIAPVEAKITVDWNLSTFIDQNYVVTGVYIVNAIDHTKLPIIRNNVPAGTGTGLNPYTWTGSVVSNIPPDGLINLPRTALSGYPIASTIAGKDFNFYSGLVYAAGFLSNDTNVTNVSMTKPKHYYMGENYSNNVTPAAGGGALVANNTVNANTLVVVRVTPKTGSTITGGDRFYTYEFNRLSTTGASGDVNNLLLGSGAINTANDGFSVRRKTNY
ncbi:MAG: hypothetical protein M0P26_08630, partial [Bacteroidales bacterium]|nr:hypothetical protein [Bacteroidales bacterium]